MLLPRLPAMSNTTELPLWPPLLATRGRGTRSNAHAHHAMHFLLAAAGDVTVNAPKRESIVAPGVLTAPDAVHSIDATDRDVLLVFLDPESDVGAALRGTIDGPYRAITDAERTGLLRDADPLAIMRDGGGEWTRRAVALLGRSPLEPLRAVHPRVKKLLRLLRSTADRETSLEALAEQVDLSPGRLMHAFTESIGIPLRPYLAWLRLQRAAGAIVSDMALGEAAYAAGFSDAAHMSRTFRRMLGLAPSELKRRGRT